MLPIHTILHPTDFSSYSLDAFRLACSLARDHGARLVVMHVVIPPVATFGKGVMVPQPDVDNSELWQQLQHSQDEAPDVAIELRILEGEPAAEILDAAHETNCDLIVMGTHGRTGLRRLLMGSVAELVVRGALCPVLTVKSPPRTKADSCEYTTAAAGQYAESAH
jgi:nucleotide-binding universal stress UspA family protein